MATINEKELKVYHFYGKDMIEGLYYRKADVDRLIESLNTGNNAVLPDPPNPRRATNRELSRWLAQGNGECLGSQDDADTAWNYPQECSDMELREGAKVRKWEDTEWHEPTVEYLFGGDDAEA